MKRMRFMSVLMSMFLIITGTRVQSQENQQITIPQGQVIAGMPGAESILLDHKYEAKRKKIEKRSDEPTEAQLIAGWNPAGGNFTKESGLRGKTFSGIITSPTDYEIFSVKFADEQTLHLADPKGRIINSNRQAIERETKPIWEEKEKTLNKKFEQIRGDQSRYYLQNNGDNFEKVEKWLIDFKAGTDELDANGKNKENSTSYSKASKEADELFSKFKDRYADYIRRGIGEKLMKDNKEVEVITSQLAKGIGTQITLYIDPASGIPMMVAPK